MQAPPLPPPPPPKPPPPLKLSAEQRAAQADLEAKRGIDALKERLARAKAMLAEQNRSEDAKLEANLLDQGVSVLSSEPLSSVVPQDDTTGTHTDATHVDLLSRLSVDSGSIGPGGDDSSSSPLAGSRGSLFIVRAPPSLAAMHERTCTSRDRFVRADWELCGGLITAERHGGRVESQCIPRQCL